MSVAPGKDEKRGVRPAAVSVAFVAVVLVAAGCGSSSPSSTAPATTTKACAWPTIDSATTANSSAPDSAATEWLQPLVVQPNLKVVVNGVYPDARYMSLNVYAARGASFTADGLGSSLPDYKIKADPGSLNPWQQAGQPGGRFSVTVTLDVSPGEANTLPLAPPATPDGTTGYLVYRVDLPAGGTASGAGLPTVTLDQGQSSTTLTACPKPAPYSTATLGGSGTTPSTTDVALAPPPTTAPPAQLQFFRAAFGSGFANADTSYVAAYFAPPPSGDVVVVTAEAPTSAVSDHPSPWPAAGEDMRYWSMCNYLDTKTLPVVANTLPGGQTDWGCRADDATKVNSSGDYTYVLGTEAQRAAIEQIPGVTFLPLSASDPTAVNLLFLRNTLVVASFANSVASAPSESPTGAALAMGAYYPHASVCGLSTLTTNGPQACATQP